MIVAFSSLKVIHGLLDRVMQLLNIPRANDGSGYFIQSVDGKSHVAGFLVFLMHSMFIMSPSTLFYANKVHMGWGYPATPALVVCHPLLWWLVHAWWLSDNNVTIKAPIMTN